ncbi:MAG: gluconate 2-dehydrogenase subunit 3 family protein [Cyclonatronaceae bacterium]
MDRREVIKLITLATGAALVGGELIFTGCTPDRPAGDSLFGRKDLDLLADIAETIMPRTHTHGAKDAGVAEFITGTVDRCYFEPDQQTFLAGLVAIEESSRSRYGKRFGRLTAEQQTEMLQDLDREARAHRQPEGGTAHYFTMIKQLTIYGYFTSEIVQKEVLRHVPIPGSYDGCMPYNEGDPAWAI